MDYLAWDERKKKFESGEKSMNTGMKFGAAIQGLKDGEKIRRVGWNGKGMYLELVKNWQRLDLTGTRIQDSNNHLPFIMIKTVDGKFVPWLASQTDILSNDWHIVETHKKSG